MTNKTKIIIGASVIVAIIIFAYIIKIQNDIANRQRNIETQTIEFKQLGDGIARLESRMVSDSASLEQKLKDLGIDYKKIQKDLDQNNAKIDAISVVVAKTPGYVQVNVPSDSSRPNPDPVDPNVCKNPHGYCDEIKRKDLFEQGQSSQIPIGFVEFDATKDQPWGVNIFPRKYYSILSMGKDSQGAVFAHSQFMIEDQNGIKHKIAVDERSFFEQVDKTYRFHWWNPRIMGEYSFGARTDGNLISMLGVKGYISAYTANYSRPTWTFIGLGAGYDMSNKKIAANFSPVAYNVFHTNDLIQNLYVAPTVSMFSDLGIGFSATVALIF